MFVTINQRNFDWISIPAQFQAMQQACTLVSYSCQTKPAISILRLHLNVASFLVIILWSCISLCIWNYSTCLFIRWGWCSSKAPLSSIFWLFLPSTAALYLLSSCCFFCQISPLLSSPLFCRWWNYPSPYIIWNMSWWSRTCEELDIISRCPYITFSLLCNDALMLQVHDQMMIDMFLRPLLLLLFIFWYIVVL